MSESKKCSKCREVKLLSEFSKDKQKKSGYTSKCKVCISNYYESNCERIKECSKRYYKENRDDICQRSIQYYHENRDYILEYQRQYQQDNSDAIATYKRKHQEEKRDIIAINKRIYGEENKESISENKRKYYQENRDRILEYHRKHSKLNPAIYRAYDAKRRALKKSTVTTDPWELTQITLFYADCPDGYHVDHIIPLAKGGCHELNNLQHLEAWMNMNKHDKHPDDRDDPRPIRCIA